MITAVRENPRRVAVKIPITTNDREAVRVLRQMEFLYNSYRHHVRLLDIVRENTSCGPLLYAELEWIEGVDLRSTLDDRGYSWTATWLGHHLFGDN